MTFYGWEVRTIKSIHDSNEGFCIMDDNLKVKGVWSTIVRTINELHEKYIIHSSFKK